MQKRNLINEVQQDEEETGETQMMQMTGTLKW